MVKTFSDSNQQSDPAMGTAIAIDEMEMSIVAEELGTQLGLVIYH